MLHQPTIRGLARGFSSQPPRPGFYDSRLAYCRAFALALALSLGAWAVIGLIVWRALS
jgi:hypothetical protein